MSMFKKGFTLAEVLITLAIIGTIATVTMPILNTNVQKSQVVPALQKTMNTLENFNKLILNDRGARSLLTLYPTSVAYGEGLLENLSGSRRVTQNYSMADGNVTSNTTDLIIETADGIILGFDSDRDVANKNQNPGLYWPNDRMTCYRVYIDTNGLKGPNKDARDVFAYYVNASNGEVLPFGGNYDNNNRIHWQNACPNGQPVGVFGRLACTAAIVENDWKIKYQY